MRKFTKIKTILILLGIIFALSTVITYNLNFNAGNNDKSSVYSDAITLDKENLKLSIVSGKIHIINNSGWIDFRNADNCKGQGIPSDPYVIEDLEIDAGGLGSCIWVENTDVYFKIENCTVYNSGGDPPDPNAGIRLSYVNNSQLIDNNCSSNENGIILYESNKNNISGNTANDNHYYGIKLDESVTNTLSGNNASYNFGGGYLYLVVIITRSWETPQITLLQGYHYILVIITSFRETPQITTIKLGYIYYLIAIITPFRETSQTIIIFTG